MTSRAVQTAAMLAARKQVNMLARRHRVPQQIRPSAIERAYRRQLMRYVDFVLVACRDLIAAMPSILVEEQYARRTDADARERLRAETKRAKERLADMLKQNEIDALAREFARRTETHQRIQLERQTKAALGADVYIADRKLPGLINGFVVENAQLITNIPERLMLDIADATARAVANATPHPKLAKDLQKRFGIARDKARLIARDQIGKLYGQVNAARQQDLGVTHFIWRTVRDDRVRGDPDGKYPKAEPSHFDREGKTYAYDDPPDGELPGEPINCFPGSTPVSSDAAVVKLYRRFYRGEGAVLTTHEGRILESTPHHPVLTARGWIPAKDVEVGDYVVKATAQRLEPFVADGQHVQPSIAEVFRALSPAGILQRRDPLAGRFHGDTSDHEIDVVDVYGGLRLEGDLELSQSVCQELLTRADEARTSPGAFHLLFDRPSATAHRLVRGGSKLLAALLVESAEASDHRGAAVAWLQSFAHQLRPDGRARDAEILRDTLHAGAVGEHLHRHVARVVAGVVRRAVDTPARLHTPSAEQLAQAIAVHVQNGSNLGDRVRGQQLDRVVERGRKDLAVHVYNLETSSSWYVAQGLIVHNCRCYPEPVFTDILSELDAFAARAPK